ncbi:ABC transporter ATP-binding protein [Acidaminococcus timonensis]|uniref:ABC transporter ATP-binding protein n=1 Tax=Acidaminococcus timonensis TaxID=1871002 RepID=UPI0026EEAB10|nr:dipeptide ABC transporter ATP-binding protein [Acidaminococcus timonensis]
MNPEETLLQAEHVKKYFPIYDEGVLFSKKIGAVKAVDDVSFSVKKGETLGIVGESGCGKSTLGKTIMRLIEPTDGKILFHGKDIVHLNKEDMRKLRTAVQMVFQDPYASLNPRMTIGRTLEEPLLIHQVGTAEERRKRVERILEEVGLDDRYYRSYPHEFSGGQRQRIAIARALINKPELIIADEAVSALDVSVQAQILNLMKDLQQRYQLTYLFISHDLSVIRYISNRILVMYLGRVMEVAEAEELFTHTLHPYTQGLLAASPSLERRRKAKKTFLGMDIPSASNPPSGCVFHTRCPYATEECSKKIPELREVGKGHFVACHQVQKAESV